MPVEKVLIAAVIWVGVGCFFTMIMALTAWGYLNIQRAWSVMGIIAAVVFSVFTVGLRWWAGNWKQSAILGSGFAGVAICTSAVTCGAMAWMQQRIRQRRNIKPGSSGIPPLGNSLAGREDRNR